MYQSITTHFPIHQKQAGPLCSIATVMAEICHVHPWGKVPLLNHV